MNTVLPGQFRYQPKQLVPFFGYDNLYRTVIEVELAVLSVMADIDLIQSDDYQTLTNEIREKVLSITTTEVDKIEREITHHDVRALVKKIQELLARRLRRFAHVPLTSYDPLDTGRILQFTRAHDEALRPAIEKVAKMFTRLIADTAHTVQIGRTHGQHALPITVGFWFATILSRILYNMEQMQNYRNGLVGKISGAVGASNAIYGLKIADRCGTVAFEDRVLTKLGLKPARISTQILPPEPVGYFLFSCAALSAALGQFGRDGRHLMRTEIGEIAEDFEAGQVGSSTMAHKRNPINFEQLEGMWLKTKNEFGKVLDTLISEHQRDLVGSAPARDFPIILVNLQSQLNTLLRENAEGVPFLLRIKVNVSSCQRNFKMSENLILAEPLYIALQMAGYEDDGHKLVNEILVPQALETNQPLIAILEKMSEQDEAIKKVLSQIPEEVKKLFYDPEQYTGNAREKALEIAAIGFEMFYRKGKE